MPERVERCVLCGGIGFRRWKQFAEWGIDKCKSCGLAVLNPHPTDAEMFEKYNEYYGYPPMPIDSEEKACEVAVQSKRVKDASRFKSPGSWFDVGAGAGTLLVRARQAGWDVYGCEIAKHLVEYATREYGLELYEGTLQEYMPSLRFDVISMYHILEHVASPLVLLRAAHERLEDNGLLVVEVPNVVSLDARLGGENWEGWALPVHFYHFTPETLVRMLERGGFQVVALEYSLPSYKEVNLFTQFVPWLRRWKPLSGTGMCAYAHKS